MKSFILSLRILSMIFIIVSLLHLYMGIQADATLGAPITTQMASEPSLDSQNRFYGVAFSLFGIALLICSNDLRRYEPMMMATFAVLFLAGIARVVAWTASGAPSELIIDILYADLLLPPIFYFWYKKICNR